MWTIGELKSKAWEALREYYWKAFLISLVIAIVSGNYGFNYNGGTGADTNGGDAIPTMLIIFIIAVILIGITLFLAFRIFIGYPLEVGGRKYFVEAQQQHEDMNFLGFAFNKARYGDIVKAMLWRAFLNFLWFLLLIIPGIVISYAYAMVPYILGDNPNIGFRRAVQLSTEMMRGHKFHLFLLELSFLGWLFLGVLALFIGVLFVQPYINAAKAELYLVLRRNAVVTGISSNEELLLQN